jgi:hypothetical protein
VVQALEIIAASLFEFTPADAKTTPNPHSTPES